MYKIIFILSLFSGSNVAVAQGMIATPTPLDFWEFAKSQEGAGWVIAFIIAFLMSIAIIVIFKEYNRREKFWRERENKLVNNLDEMSAKYAAEKDERHEEGLELLREGYSTMTKLSESIQSNEAALKRVNEAMIECRRRST